MARVLLVLAGHMHADPEDDLLRCDERVGTLYGDAPEGLQDILAVSAMVQGMAFFTSLCPRASWDGGEYKVSSDASSCLPRCVQCELMFMYQGRVAFIKTLEDSAISMHVQQMMLDASGVE
jgi:hypothetical protein